MVKHMCFNCPNRTPECRLTCEPFREYDADRLRQMEERAAQFELNSVMIVHKRETVDRMRRMGYNRHKCE